MNENKLTNADKLGIILFVLLFFAFLVLFKFLIVRANNLDAKSLLPENITYTTTSRNLKSINLSGADYSNSQGSFFLLFGSYQSESGSKTVYRFYEQNDEGYVLREVDAEGLTVKETVTEPKVNYESRICKIKHADCEDYDDKLKSIEVPSGSIKTMYDLNLGALR